LFGLLAGEAVRVALRGCLPGAARQPLTFFAFAKESKQRKATASRCPCGVPKKWNGKAGSETNSPSAQTSFASFSALPLHFLAAPQRIFNSNGNGKTASANAIPGQHPFHDFAKPHLEDRC
jgi:hypothetical protein